jgi:hypothetical protein
MPKGQFSKQAVAARQGLETGVIDIVQFMLIGWSRGQLVLREFPKKYEVEAAEVRPMNKPPKRPRSF